MAPGIELLPGGAAHLVRENVLVVADMHLGVEAALEYEGVSLPRVQTAKISEYMAGLMDLVSPSKVVVAGDLKHNFSRNLTQEWHGVGRFVKSLSGKASLEVVRGNHDNYLGVILREYGVPLKKEVTVSGVRILHGHAGRPGGKPVIMGHIHPSLRLRDGAGASVKNPCFLYNSEERILVLPALSVVAYGVDVVGQPSSDLLSPLLPKDGLSNFLPIVFSGDKPLIFPKIGRLRMMD
ncbi:MAG: metallophosphoesterase [Thermoplasmata archaeon]